MHPQQLNVQIHTWLQSAQEAFYEAIGVAPLGSGGNLANLQVGEEDVLHYSASGTVGGGGGAVALFTCFR